MKNETKFSQMHHSFVLRNADSVSYPITPRSHLAEYVRIVYDRDNGAIANNTKAIGTVIVSVEKKSVSST